ncbi:unnamed protein product [Mytilus edulis]|uniref:GH16 domain-containing protein n=1 Tax=Mytilus edulis TaxID=6550 RepID=A0A8S3S620_MYTED|nr:unnamed protein product [Mytilus edulis]
MKDSVLGLVFTLALACALEPEVILEKPFGLRLRLKDESSLLGVKFEVQPEGQKIYKEFIEHTLDGAWEFHLPEVKIAPGGRLRYRLTAYFENNIDESDWKTHEVEPLKPVRSMKRAVVFRDDYNSFNQGSYSIECSAWGGGNDEFQVYTNQGKNLFSRGGHLYIKPTLTIDDPHYDSNRLYHGRMIVKDDFCGYCSQSTNWGCDRTAVNGNVLNPIMSGKVTTHASIRYGTVTVRAKIPRGDWIWPAIWMLPKDWHYGGWPRSGEIDLMEARCNAKVNCGGNDHGIGEVASTLHWGPSPSQNGFMKTHGEKDKNGGDWADGFHIYKLEWYADHIRVTVDGQQIMYVGTPGNGFYNYGGFGGSNIWASGGNNAPFDQPFQLIMNVAVGGGFFSSGCSYNHPRPWNDGSNKQMREFWDRRGEWLSTWHGDNVAMQIDYVEMVQA